MIHRARARLARALDRRIGAVDEHVGRVEDRLGAIEARLEALEAGIASQHGAVDRLAFAVGRVDALLRIHVADDPGNRRRLGAARAEAGHDAAWTDDEPLVSICIATHDRLPTLLERSIPSALAQTHAAIEVLVVGDAAPPHVAEAVTALGDPRVRFASTTARWAHEDPQRQRLTAATLPRNEAYRLARGRWLLDLDDDDELVPDAVERLLARARDDRLEVVYGDLEQLGPGGRTVRLGGFPPRFGQFGWQGALVHAGLRFFTREQLASELGVPGDWYRMERMLRSGVRIGHLPEVTCRYYPSADWAPD